MEAQGHVNMIPNYLFIQITTMMTWKCKRKLEFLSIYALKKKKKTEPEKEVKAMRRCKILAELP